ncbi:MAG TPA: aminopeptidase [Candidatus Limnocylindrales bacterium]|nr:aminopeptidase [Candidatus Limnocylindrales bacterium]
MSTQAPRAATGEAGEPGEAALPIEEVAGRVVGRYLGLRAGEHLVVVVDRRTDVEIPRALADAARAAGGEAMVVTIEPRARSGAEPPEAAARAMAAADVVVCAASTSLYHTAAKAAAQRAGARGVFNAPWRADAWRRGAMTADFFAIRRRAESLAALLRATRAVRLTSPAGTDLRARIEGREPMAWRTAICLEPGEVSALPGGEVSLPPLEGTSQGIVVWERVASDLGRLDSPLRITVRGGRAVAVEGGPQAEQLRRVLAEVRDSDNIGEIGIGLNPAARIADDITEAKKALGTVHVALGDSANEYGGLVESEVHLDGLVIAPTLWLDERAVIVDGRHLDTSGA